MQLKIILVRILMNLTKKSNIFFIQEFFFDKNMHFFHKYYFLNKKLIMIIKVSFS